MREDIAQLLNTRDSWVLHNDKIYQEFQEALKYAQQTNNQEAQEEIKLWILQRKQTLLNHF